MYKMTVVLKEFGVKKFKKKDGSEGQTEFAVVLIPDRFGNEANDNWYEVQMHKEGVRSSWKEKATIGKMYTLECFVGGRKYTNEKGETSYFTTLSLNSWKEVGNG